MKNNKPTEDNRLEFFVHGEFESPCQCSGYPI